jgi:hypothetical protein
VLRSNRVVDLRRSALHADGEIAAGRDVAGVDDRRAGGADAKYAGKAAIHATRVGDKVGSPGTHRDGIDSQAEGAQSLLAVPLLLMTTLLSAPVAMPMMAALS